MAIGNLKLENYVPVVKLNEGTFTKKPVVLSGTSATLAVGGTLTVTGATTFSSGFKRPTSSSALVGATVVLTEADSGKTFINRSTSGSPSWTLPTTPADGTFYTFYTANTTAGFTVTGGTIFARASATGASVTGTTLTNTQGTAVVGDNITLTYDATSNTWKGTGQNGIFAAA